MEIFTKTGDIKLKFPTHIGYYALHPQVYAVTPHFRQSPMVYSLGKEEEKDDKGPYLYDVRCRSQKK